MVQLTQKMQKKLKSEKRQKTVTSHYANGHGDPCDKWVKNHTTTCTQGGAPNSKIHVFFTASRCVRISSLLHLNMMISQKYI